MSGETERALCVLSSCEQSRWVGFLCAPHHGSLLRFLREIPKHARTVKAMTGHATTPQTERTSGSKDQPLLAGPWLGIVGPATDARVLSDPECDVDPPLLFTVASWALVVEDGLSLAHQHYTNTLTGLSAACQTLAANLAWMSAQAWIDECWDEIDLACRNVRAVAGDNPQPQRGKIPCPSCGMRALWQEEPSMNVAERDKPPLMVGGEYRCVKRLNGCGAAVLEVDHDAAMVELDTAIETTKANRSVA